MNQRGDKQRPFIELVNTKPSSAKCRTCQGRPSDGQGPNLSRASQYFCQDCFEELLSPVSSTGVAAKENELASAQSACCAVDLSGGQTVWRRLKLGVRPFGEFTWVWACEGACEVYTKAMSTVAKQLLKLSRKLPPGEVREVMDFAEFLLARSSAPTSNGAGKGGKALRRYIGGVKHGTLASGIDDALYGRLVR